MVSRPPPCFTVTSGSSRNDSPTPLPLGHNARATDSDTMTTGSWSRSNSVNARPRTMGMPSTSKYADDTDLNVTDVLPAPVSAKATRSGASNCGLTAAYAVMVDSPASAWIMAARFGSLSMSINTVSAVRSPGLNWEDAIALRRKIAAQINSSADAKTCTPIKTLRARPGRASLTSSPRSVRTGSIRVACSAGISAKNPVAPTAATTRNTATRQSAAGTPRLMSPRSTGIVRRAQYTAPSRARREIR